MCDQSDDFPEWYVDDVNGVWKQHNGCDCNVFTCMFALLLYVDQPIYFDQKLIIGNSAGTQLYCKF